MTGFNILHGVRAVQNSISGFGDAKIDIPVVFVDQRVVNPSIFSLLISPPEGVRMTVTFWLSKLDLAQSYFDHASDLFFTYSQGQIKSDQWSVKELEVCLEKAISSASLLDVYDDHAFWDDVKLAKQAIATNIVTEAHSMLGDLKAAASPDQAASHYLQAVRDSNYTHLPSLTNLADLFYKHDIAGISPGRKEEIFVIAKKGSQQQVCCSAGLWCFVAERSRAGWMGRVIIARILHVQSNKNAIASLVKLVYC